MKKLLFTLALSLCSLRRALYIALFLAPCSLQAQTIPPPYINYQAVLYDVNGTNPNAVLANQSFPTFVNIQDELGNLLYKEEHYASTDANGLITVKMGDGVYLAGPITNFNLINWAVGKYYLVVDFDINGTISSTAPEQLVTVPYSFYAGKAGNGMTAVADNGNGTLTFTYANGQTYITPTLSGIQGPIGPAGAPGANGLNALIKTANEPAGVNCANGGTKIETGLDANGNGALDVGEINVGQTKYVCNGSSTGSGTSTYSIGLVPELGGFVFWISADNKHGLVAEIQDCGITDFFNAQNIISTPLNHSAFGQNFTDWRLPTKYELNEMYMQQTTIGGFQNSAYWSSTEGLAPLYWYYDFVNGVDYGFGHSHYVDFNNGVAGLVKKKTSIRVRAVRSF